MQLFLHIKIPGRFTWRDQEINHFWIRIQLSYPFLYAVRFKSKRNNKIGNTSLPYVYTIHTYVHSYDEMGSMRTNAWYIRYENNGIRRRNPSIFSDIVSILCHCISKEQKERGRRKERKVDTETIKMDGFKFHAFQIRNNPRLLFSCIPFSTKKACIFFIQVTCIRCKE